MMNPQRKQILILIGSVLLLVGMACYAECPSLSNVPCKGPERDMVETEIAKTDTAWNAKQPTSQETPLPASQFTSTTVSSTKSVFQIILGTGSTTNDYPYPSPRLDMPRDVQNVQMKLTINSATFVELEYDGKQDAGFSFVLGTADVEKKIATFTSCDNNEVAKGTVDYSSGTLVGEVDCFFTSDGSHYLKITLP